MNAKVTVIVAIHNGADNLKNSLDSIKNQTLKDMEVIMVDAASTDETADVMKKYTADGRFSFFSLPGTSISEARNFAMKKATGKYISFGDSNVIFTSNLLEGMYDCAEKEQADMCVAPMASSDVYGKHIFTSTDILSRRKQTNKFDVDLIWNPAVTNKLFLAKKIKENGFEFRYFGKAREAAFSLSFAFSSDVIACSSKGAASYIVLVKDEGVSAFPIEHYLGAYEYIIEEAVRAFGRAIEESTTDFEKKELKKQMVSYIDEVYHKELTVLLYSYYRHFWSLSDSEIKKYVDIIMSIFSKLSKSGKSALKKKNKDIFFGDRLIDSKKEMAERPKVTVCIGKSHNEAHISEERLLIQVESIFNQTMPCFELFVDDRLYDSFPEKYKNKENITFIEAESLGEFKDLALEKSRTGYIMYQDGFARLNPKILMRHFNSLEGKEKYGFSTSLLTRFDGKRTGEYSFSDLYFYSDMGQNRVDSDDKMFALDLFFCNKLFRTDHLNGIHFTFTDNPVYDMYKLYKHSRFKKLSHRGAYLPYTEEEAMAYLRREERLLDSSRRRVYKTYKYIYFRYVTLKNKNDKLKDSISSFRRLLISLCGILLTFVFTKMKIQRRVFFFTGRATGTPDENLDRLYKCCDSEKVLFAKERPHSLVDIAKIRYYLLTSKVIVTDDYINYLRKARLREGQKVVQIWYTGGAFKRMGIDGPSTLSIIDEYKTHSQYSDFCVSSEYVRQYYAHAFGLDMEVVKATGTPRSDLVVDKAVINKNYEEMCSKHPLLRHKKVYVYCPTVRIKEDSIIPFDPKIDWSKLNDDLADDEVFIICRHPSMKEEYVKGMFFSRVKDYTFEPTSEVLSVADVMITDYSSIVFDASLMNKPMVFYCPDYKDYAGEFYLDYERELPGERVMAFDELLSAVRRAGEKSSSEVIADFREKQMGACDGQSTGRILEIIKEYLK